MSYRPDKQVIDTHTLTDTQTWAMTIPEGRNWPRVKMTEDLKYDLFGTQNYPEMGPLRPILNTPLKVAQIDMYAKTDTKPVENF